MIGDTMIDSYVQSMMRGESDLTVAERARHSVAAIVVHVLTEARLPMDTALLIDTDEIEREWRWLHEGFADARNGLMEDVLEVREDLGLLPAESDDEEPAVEEATEDLTALSDLEVEERAAQERMNAFMRGDALG